MNEENCYKSGYDIVVDKTEDGEFLLFLTTGNERTCLSSKYSPSKEADRILEEYKNTESDVVIIFGCGNCALIEKGYVFFKKKKIIIIEKEKEIIECVKNYLSEKVVQTVYFFDEKNYYYELKKLFEKCVTSKITLIPNRTEVHLFEDFFKQVKTDIISLHDRKSINISTFSRFEKLWLRNIYNNTISIISAFPIRLFKDAGNGKTAVLVAAGPSLATHLPLLKSNQDKIFIIAADTVYKVLLKNQIIPDIVCVVDPQKVNSRYVENVDHSIVSRTWFLCEPAVCPASLRDKNNRVLMFNTIFPYFAFLAAFFGDKGDLDMGGSVVTTLFECARELNFTKSAFLGLDLSFSDDAYHLPGTMYEEWWFSSVKRFKSFEMMTYKLFDYAHLWNEKDINGKMVYMDSRFLLFRQWFENKLNNEKLMPHFCNASEAGVGIKGLSTVTFRQFLDDSEHAGQNYTADEKQQLHQSFAAISVEYEVKNQVNFYEKKSACIAHAEEIKLKIQDYYRCCEQAEKTASHALQYFVEKKDINKLLLKLNSYDNELSKDFVGKEFINYALQKIINAVQAGKSVDFGRPVEEKNKPLETSIALYREMKKTAVLNLRYLTFAIENMINLKANEGKQK